MSPITMVIIAAVFLLISLLLMYLFTGPSTLLFSNVNLASGPITSTKIDKPNSVNFTYYFWINVESWNTNAQKHIINYSDGTNNLFQIYLDPADLGLYCSIMTQSPSSPVQTVLITNNLPLQAWNLVVVSAQNLNVDCYLNGLMTNAMILHAPQVQVPNKGVATVTVGDPDNLKGRLYNVARISSETNPYAVWQYYAVNYMVMNSSLLGNQNVKLSFLKNGQVQGNVSLL
jgi:hypothetical protein